ncbi:hypothetical protein RMCBS344292_12510 [Rhizopus microsporus]|nr:hypothetical protein RMCBS344292_12510 [Rhizopus microsporus]
MSEVAVPVTADGPIKDDAVKKAQKQRRRNKKKSKKQRLAEEAQRKELEKQHEKDDLLKDVEVEYVVQPIDLSALKKADGMSKLDENTLQQFSEIFKHFQNGKPEQDEEVRDYNFLVKYD